MPVTTRSIAAVTELDAEIPRQVPITVSVSGSQVSSSRSSSSKVRSRLLAAKYNESRLKALMALEEEEFKLKQKRRIFDVQNELHLAKLEVTCDEEEADEFGHISCADNISRVESYVADCKTNALRMKPAEATTSQVHDEWTMRLLAAGLELPKVELNYFDGKPVDYWRFARQFEYHIESTVLSDGKRLLYLQYYCRGKAKEAINECSMLPPERGYATARKILQERFGQTHQVARAMLDKLLDDTKLPGFSADELSALATRMESCNIALTEMSYTADLNALNTLESIVRVLPKPLQHQWAERVDRIGLETREPKFLDLQEFVAARARIAGSRFGQLAGNDGGGSRSTNFSPRPRLNDRRFSSSGQRMLARANHVALETSRCVLCTGEHELSVCNNFTALEIPERWDVAKGERLCFRCLQHGHQANYCSEARGCHVANCRAKHHSLLHNNPLRPVPTTTHASCSAIRATPGRVALGVVPVRVVGQREVLFVNAFIDNGSDTTLMSRELANRLQLSGDSCQLTLSTVTGARRVESEVVTVEVSSLNGMDEIKIERAFVVPGLPVKVPVKVTQKESNHWPHLADINFQEILDEEISLLIGADVPEAHWILDQRLGGNKQPYAVKTRLGWMILGPLGPNKQTMARVNCLQRDELPLAEQIRKLYDAEFADTEALAPALSVDDAKAVQIVRDSVLQKNSHYVVPLPWRDSYGPVWTNRSLAEKRLEYLKRRFLRDPEFFSRYASVLDQTFAKGYAIQVPPSQLSPGFSPRWYLPHHAVCNPKKPEKLRVVLDCAARFRGLSLNDRLYQGPDVTIDLISVLMRFRKGRIALAADVEEMFMQVMVPEDDRGALRFLWWPENDLSKEPSEYQMIVHPFGAVSSPFCANFALRKTVEDYGEEYDEKVSQAIMHNFYVDDCLVSFEDLTEATQFVPQICHLLAKGGFRLRKWLSNKGEALSLIPQSEWSPFIKQIGDTTATNERMLGIEWDHRSDMLYLRFNIPNCPLTRRGILSSISSIFDPLGLISPLILPAKIVLQRMCKSHLGWDDPISSCDAESWREWLMYVNHLGQIEIPRYIQNKDDQIKGAQLHLFSDASESGYGAVAYARFIPRNNQPYCTLLFAKSRVAPLKTVTIPRMELGAAALAVRIQKIVTDGLQIQFDEVIYWTDSAIVLHYIDNTSARFNTFVANRVSAIHEASLPTQWKHVRSNDNPADMVSRGIRSQKDLCIWLNGPDFLLTSEPYEFDSRPEAPLQGEIELKSPKAFVHAAVQNRTTSPLLSYFSNWLKLLKSVAWLRRFKQWIIDRSNTTIKSPSYPRHLTVDELENAKKDVIRLVQREAYPGVVDELTTDQKQQNISIPKMRKISQLRKLCPIVTSGIICVGGRLEYTNYGQEIKHPAILPSNHPVVDMIIRFFHAMEGHSGPSHVLSIIRKFYWIVRGNQTVKRVIGGCIKCQKKLASFCEQQMSPLPVARAELGWYPFEHVGIDYFGPIHVKRGRGTEKRFGCIFTCLKIRAVHLEVANDLSSDAFINTLIRFVGRRGCPSHIYSDNGSNFVGAVRELREVIQRWDHEKINNHLLTHCIQWHFNPPSCSHRGGVWERMIRSTRKILYGLSNTQILTEDSLATLFVEVERIMNGRPLVSPPSDNQALPPLTPNNLLLIQRESGLEISIDDLSQRYTRRWRQVQQMVMTFWHRWLNEYILTLQTRQKWLRQKIELRIGDWVLIANEDMPRITWPMGVVSAVEPSQDGLIRTVTVKTSKGVVRRDVRKLCRLEGIG